ncbi:MAG: TMEM165/GDT1 family protein [Cyanobacteria bacterium P01_F01_bin.153]
MISTYPFTVPQPILDPPKPVGESTQVPTNSVSGQAVQTSCESADDSQGAEESSTFLSVFGTTFLAIFAAEFGDKTQLAVLLMSAESQRPWLVFSGAAIALIATSLVGVLLGRLLAKRISEKLLEKVVGGIFVAVATSLLWDVLHAA